MLEKEITFDRFVRILGIVLLVGGVMYTMNFLSSVLLPFFVAWLLAYLMYPIVKFVQYKLHVPTRALPIILRGAKLATNNTSLPISCSGS